MGNTIRDLLEDIAEGARRVLDELENLLYPEKRRRKQLPVPVRIPRPPDRKRPRNPNR